MIKKHIDITLILPCFNEISVFDESVRLIFQTLLPSNFTYEFLFVDDGSSDGTRTLIEKVCKKEKLCRFIFHDKNRGRGAAVMTGIHQARGSIVGYMDIDCEVSPIYIPNCIQLIQEHQADIVVGKRIYRTSFSSIFREVLSVGYRWIANQLLKTGGIDTESGYKFFNKKKFLPVMKTIQNRHWFWDTESIVRSLRRGLRVREVPVLFNRREDKQSSVRIVRDTYLYFIELFRFVRES